MSMKWQAGSKISILSVHQIHWLANWLTLTNFEIQSRAWGELPMNVCNELLELDCKYLKLHILSLCMSSIQLFFQQFFFFFSDHLSCALITDTEQKTNLSFL